MRFFTGATERMRIDSSGNVGIGSSVISGVLQVTGSDTVEGDAKGQIVIKDSAAYNASPTMGIIFQGEHTTGSQAHMASIYGAKENATIGNYAGYLGFATRAQGSTTAERMRIDSSGRVGIGTTSPGTPLDVNGTARATQFRLASTGVIDDATATTTATTQVAIDAFSSTAYGGSKVIIEAKSGVNRHITELLVTHDGTTAIATEYGTIYTSGVLATYTVDISGGNVRVLATPASATSTSFKIMRTTMFA